MKIDLDRVRKFLIDMLIASRLPENKAQIIADIYIRSTLRGVEHHDINDFSGRINNLIEKKVNPDPDFTLITSSSGAEVWDGDNGLGEICSYHIMKRAEELASLNGIGYVVIKHSNHFLASYPYVQIASEEGFVSMIYCHTKAAMPAPGRLTHVIGNSPMGYGLPTEGEPIVFDTCMASCSYGEINKRINQGTKIPEHWARDKEGNPSSDPHIVADKTGTITAVGEHKGYGLSILTEALTAVMANGPVIDQNHEDHEGVLGVYTQSVICIDPRKLNGSSSFEEKAQEMKERMYHLDGEIKLPGERSQNMTRETNMKGFLSLSEEKITQLNTLADRLGVTKL